MRPRVLIVPAGFSNSVKAKRRGQPPASWLPTRVVISDQAICRGSHPPAGVALYKDSLRAGLCRGDTRPLG
ncbi:hypothetical protein B296_00002094 [Ensete ventricosum]|uniref:Uncharacterized protein n=1 Tax=Ensete ventricosum TaxID=4639 RepID=A0A426YTI1_ENSVE|nr:hypothetical protein B296_00002094 [Ensete ventricosum]